MGLKENEFNKILKPMQVYPYKHNFKKKIFSKNLKISLNGIKKISMIGILNYGSGNITSLSNSLTEIGKKHILINNPKEFKNIEKLIIPGVGSYHDAVKK